MSSAGTVGPRTRWLLASIVFLLVSFPLGAASAGPPANRVLLRALETETGQAQAQRFEKRLSSGPLLTVLQASGEIAARLEFAAQARATPELAFSGIAPLALDEPSPTPGTQGCSRVLTAGTRKNTRVNQDCSLRRQAEEVIAINPTNPKNLIAGANDNRIGFNHCSYAWAFDGGKTWGDQAPPFYQFALLSIDQTVALYLPALDNVLDDAPRASAQRRARGFLRSAGDGSVTQLLLALSSGTLSPPGIADDDDGFAPVTHCPFAGLGVQRRRS